MRRIGKAALTLATAGALSALGQTSAAHAATLAGPVAWGSPDQPWGARRAVTAQDRAAVAAYRSGRKTPTFSTDFTSSADLAAHWTAVSDDSAGLKSCRRPASVGSSPSGLRLKILPAQGCRTARWSTGYIASKAKYGYGFYEARVKIADIKGVDNAFWLTTDGNYEIDVTETFYPSYMHLGLQDWPTGKIEKHAGVGWGATFREILSQGFHDVGLLWTPNEMVYEVDGEPIAAVVTHGAVKGPATVRLSTALADWAGGKVPDHPGRPPDDGAVTADFRAVISMRAAVVWALVAAFATTAWAAEPPPVVGVGLVNEPYKQTAPELETTFKALQAAGVNVIRAGIPDSPAGLAFAKDAKAHGIAIDWLVGVYPDPGTAWRQLPDAYKGKGFWRGWPLSTANADMLRTTIGAQLARLEGEGIVLAGFELGNEINWTGFNSDFTLPTTGRVLTAKDLVGDPEGRTVARGYLRYLKSLAALKDLRDGSRLNRRTPIISAGLADLDDSGTWLASVKADAVSVDATLDFMRANGLDRLVDGYGLHFYPYAASPGSAQGLAALRAHLTLNGLTECAAPGAAKGKPCWVTEWNFNGIKGLDACPIDDGPRIAMVGEMRAALHDLAVQHRLGGSIYYTWQGQIHAPKEDKDSAFLCGGLTQSGKLALSPMWGDDTTTDAPKLGFGAEQSGGRAAEDVGALGGVQGIEGRAGSS